MFSKSPLKIIEEWALPKKKLVFSFDEGSMADIELLGKKGANLCEMFRIGLPVPAGYIISTENCSEYKNKIDKNEKTDVLPEILMDQIKKSIHEVEIQTGDTFGGVPQSHLNEVKQSEYTPLLLSIRPSAKISMSGIMNTILHLGLNDQIVLSLATVSNNPRFAYDTYRRFLENYGVLVMNIEKEKYIDILLNIKKKRGIIYDNDFTISDLQEIIYEFKKLCIIPDNPWDQLHLAILSLYKTWYSPHAINYRDIHNMDNISVTAIVIQTMVYGNMNTRSGSGIAYTRDPMTGQKILTGDYLINADGDEIVAGIRKTIKLNELFIHQPSVFEKLMDISSILENHYKDMQCIEFTVQNGTLFILETSKGKRNPASAIKMVVSMVQENMINEREALMRIDPSYMNSFGNQSIDPTVFEGDEENKSIEYLKIGNGIGISNGIASGRIAFDSVVNITNEKEKSAIILCIDNDYPSLESNTELKSVNGILMLQGNALSFPSIAMKRLGRPVLINTKNMLIDLTNKCLISRNGTVYHEGDYITIDGNTGIVYQGNLPIFNHENDFSYYTILKWADQYKRMKILPNIDSDKDIKALHTMKSVDGIGEFNTEFLFFRTEKDLELLQLSILEIDKTKRTFYIRQLYTSQKEYFVNLFIRQLTILHDKSIIFRLINNDICRFLPNSMDNSYFSDIEKLSKLLLINASECFSRITALHRNIDEQCDIYEELLRMHCKSVLVGIVEANKLGLTYFPTFSIQHMFSHREVEKIISQIDDAMKEMIPEYPNVLNIPFAVGCDLKVPRACIRIEKLVSIPEIRVISIDSNALTAAIFGIDHSKMIEQLTYYLQNHILAHDPFDNIDLHGVGSLISAVVEKAKSVNSKVEIGVHGNHCGNSKSIFFFDKLKIDFISCSSDQLPCAKVAAARSNIIQMQRDKEQRYEKFWNMIEGGNILY